VERLPHGYTNRTRRLPGDLIEKVYDGPARFDNARREAACLRSLEGRLPLPRLVSYDAEQPRITLTSCPGAHGQDLIDAGRAPEVLRLVGTALAALHATDLSVVDELTGEGDVIVHGDFGPQNMLFDLERGEVSAIIDWESAHFGSRVEDLAWSEWIVREHHPDAVDALPELFDASGLAVAWTARHDAMLRQMTSVLRYCESSGFAESAADWARRISSTEGWRE
jgi:aminoglycoside phosphotransferase